MTKIDEDQLDFFTQEKVNSYVPIIKPKPLCSWHPWIPESSLIDITIKKTGQIIKRCLHCEREKLENRKERLEVWKKEKAELTDYYLRRTMRMKTKLEMNEIPDELIEVQRAVTQLKRLKDKMIEDERTPLKICPFHGKLFRDKVNKNGNDRHGNPTWKCKECMKIYHAKHYTNHKEKVLEKNRTYKKENAEKVAEIKKNSRSKHREKYRENANLRKRILEKKNCLSLSNRYVKKLLVKHTKLSMKDVPSELIELQRLVIQLKRNIKSRKITLITGENNEQNKNDD